MTAADAAPAAMRVALVSWTEPGGMGHSLERGFSQLGVDCSLIRYPRWAPWLRLPRIRGVGAAGMLIGAAQRPLASLDVLRQLRAVAPDVVLFLKCDDLPRWVYRRLQQQSKMVLAAFHPDDPFNRGKPWRPGPSHRRSVVQLQEVDLYFSWSKRVLARAGELGVQRGRYLPFACDPELHRRPAGDQRGSGSYAADVCFIGNWDEERQWWLGQLARRGLDLAIWGTADWSTRCTDPAVRAAWRGRALFGAEFAAAVATSRVNINVLRVQNKGACNMRTFEIPCCGGFMLHERSEESAELFAPGLACDDFASPDELAEKIRYYLAHEQERRCILERGYQVAMKRTYTDWVDRVLVEVREYQRSRS